MMYRYIIWFREQQTEKIPSIHTDSMLKHVQAMTHFYIQKLR